MLIYPQIKESPIVGLSGMGGGTTGLSVAGAGIGIKTPFDWAFNFNGGSATLGYQSGSAQSNLSSTGTVLGGWSSTGGIDNSGHFGTDGADSNDNKWDFPSTDSVEGNQLNDLVSNFDQYALSCWVKTTSTANSGCYTVYETILGDTSGSVSGGLGITQGKPCVTNECQDLIGTSTVNSGDWEHIGFILESSTCKIFINGELNHTYTGITWSNGLRFKNLAGTYNYGNVKINKMDALVIWVDRNITDQDITNAYTVGNFDGI